MKNATIIASFLWIGFLCAISFMEAWLKFRAEGVTLPIGLSIGKIVFTALNKMEWFFAIIIIAGLVVEKVSLFKWQNTSIAVPLIMLLLQTLWLLPILNQRATLQIQGQTVPASNLHFVYVTMELIKVVSLFVFGMYLLRK